MGFTRKKRRARIYQAMPQRSEITGQGLDLPSRTEPVATEPHSFLHGPALQTGLGPSGVSMLAGRSHLWRQRHPLPCLLHLALSVSIASRCASGAGLQVR
jgi:hypothetical protein